MTVCIDTQKRLCCWVLFLVVFLWALYIGVPIKHHSLSITDANGQRRHLNSLRGLSSCVYDLHSGKMFSHALPACHHDIPIEAHCHCIHHSTITLSANGRQTHIHLVGHNDSVYWRSEAVVLLNVLLGGVPVGILYRSDLQTTLLKVLWNFRVWRKISWRYSFFRCLYPCLGERFECPLCFVRFPSCLKLSVVSIWVARNGHTKGDHFVRFAPAINWPRGLNRRTIYIYITHQYLYIDSTVVLSDIDKTTVHHVSVGLTQARPNDTKCIYIHTQPSNCVNSRCIGS